MRLLFLVHKVSLHLPKDYPIYTCRLVFMVALNYWIDKNVLSLTVKLRTRYRTHKNNTCRAMLQRLITTIRHILFSLANNLQRFPTTIIFLQTVHRNLNTPNLVLFGCFPISNQIIRWNIHQNNSNICIQYLPTHMECYCTG